MLTIHELKEQEVTETPLLLFDCELRSGTTVRWSTHRVEFEGQLYEARVLKHNVFEFKSWTEDGVDAISKISLTLGNVDSQVSEIERSTGWKGSRLTVRFVFFDLRAGQPASASRTLFLGAANPPEEIAESTARLSFTNRLNLQRLLLPEVRIQRRCPWAFPATLEQRREALNGGARGKFSPFQPCGYSADQEGGAGSLNGDTPYTTCDYTRSQCQQRGMFDADSQGHLTRRFGGIEFVPSSTVVRSYGEKGTHVSSAVENEALYNDFVPLVYGTAWYKPPIVFARNDGNLTRVEVLLGMGEMQGVLKVLVDDVEIPQGVAGTDMTATGWYNVATPGARGGGFNLDFLDAQGKPAGDPYGSMAMMSVVVPNVIHQGTTLPRIEVLAEGMKLRRYDAAGNDLGESFSNNPAWVLLDVLQRTGWNSNEIDVTNFATTSAYCDQPIPSQDLNGNPILIPRFQCNLVLRKRRSAADVLRGVRGGAGVSLTYGADGKLQLRPESSLAVQQPSKPEDSNAETALNGGWPAYEFGDGTNGFSGILRKANQEPTLRLWSRATADSPNRYSTEFQDAFNEYQQDSLSLVDVDDEIQAGQEISVTLSALGIPNCDQAARVIRRQLDKSIRGNTYAEFETTVRGIGLQPGDIITLTYLKEGFDRQPFRITALAPGLNYQTTLITAQLDDDSWYDDANGLNRPGNGSRQATAVTGIPRPLVGKVLDEYGQAQLAVSEEHTEGADGGMMVLLQVEFSAPTDEFDVSVAVPRIGFNPVVETIGGVLAGGHTFYYAVSGVGGSGEGSLSFIVRAAIPAGTDTNQVTLTGLSFGANTTSFHVYRGTTPSQLYRIAANHAPGTGFTDTGLEAMLQGPPDANFDHVNFYWRWELLPETQTTIHGANQIGDSALQMLAGDLRGSTVRITRGRGAGQERLVASNTTTVLTLTTDWAVEPDETSFFVVAESNWQLATSARTSPVKFEVPNREGATVQISGRAANVRDAECPYAISPLTRWRINGAAGSSLDLDLPGAPQFGFIPKGRGTVELAGVSFENQNNTRTVTAATLGLNYWDELSSPSLFRLGAAVLASDTSITLTRAGTATAGDFIQVESEVMQVESVLDNRGGYQVMRGVHGSSAAGHDINSVLYHLQKKLFIVPFTKDFFGSPASGSYSYPVLLADARIASAEVYATNSRGNGPITAKCLTGLTDDGLRTYSGGQISIQVEGYLAIQASAAPPLVIEAAHAVRDIFAVVGEAPTGGAIELRLRQDDEVYCPPLTIPVTPAGTTISNVINGFGLAPLRAGARLCLDITSVAQTADSTPGRDLTVTIRL